MSQQPLPIEVAKFIDTYINSVEQLEILLLLRSASTADWSARRVSDALRTNESSAAVRLADLAAHRILVVTGAAPVLYRYAPNPSSLDHIISALAAAYVDYRVRIIEAIFSKPNEYVRVYANAFRVRKDDRDG